MEIAGIFHEGDSLLKVGALYQWQICNQMADAETQWRPTRVSTAVGGGSVSQKQWKVCVKSNFSQPHDWELTCPFLMSMVSPSAARFNGILIISDGAFWVPDGFKDAHNPCREVVLVYHHGHCQNSSFLCSSLTSWVSGWDWKQCWGPGWGMKAVVAAYLTKGMTICLSERNLTTNTNI